MQYNRNEFLKLMSLSAVGAAALSSPLAIASPVSRPAAEGLTLGLASYLGFTTKRPRR